MGSVKQKFISGVLWESIGRFSALGVQFAVTILIARVLSPTEFGIVGILTVFIALGQIFLDSGFSQALIQRKNASQIDLSSVYFLNMLVGIIIYTILYVFSPFVADFYNLPELKNFARVLFLIIPINSFGLVQNVIIQKELAFKKTASANIGSAIISGVVGVTMAYNGFGVWALISQQLSLHFSKTLLYIIQRRWVPLFKISLGSIRDMFSFSINLMMHSFVNVTMKNIYVLVIGKFFPLAQVGYYNQATKFEEISAGTISQVVLNVSFPALVQKKDEPTYLRNAYIKIFSTSIYLVAPLMFFLIAIGEPLFGFLLTDKWLPAVPYFQILCIHGVVLPILQISYNLYKIFGKGRTLLMIDALRHIIVLISIFLTISFGIKYMLLGLVICTVIMALLNLRVSGRLISLSVLNQLKSILPYYFLSALIGLLVYELPNYRLDVVTVLYKGLIFFICYFLVSKKLRFSGYLDVISIFIAYKNKVVK